MRGPFLCQDGMTSGCTGAGTIGTAGGFGGTPLATGTGPVGAGAGGVGDADRATGFTRGFLRFGIFCRSSHTRSVSSETPTPSLASDSVIRRIDAPPRRSVSSTSRYGSSAANRREQSCRPSAIKRASACALSVAVAGTSLSPAGMVAGVLWINADGRAVAGRLPYGRGADTTASSPMRGMGMFVGLAGCIRAIYLPPAGGAIVAPRAISKRKRLDVGVLTYLFLLVLVSGVGSFFGSLCSWFTQWVYAIGSVSFSWVECFSFGSLVNLSSWFLRLVKFLRGLVLGSFRLSLVFGGGGC